VAVSQWWRRVGSGISGDNFRGKMSNHFRQSRQRIPFYRSSPSKPRLPFLFDPHPVDSRFSNLDNLRLLETPPKSTASQPIARWISSSTMQLPSTVQCLSKTTRTSALEAMLSAHSLLYPNSTSSLSPKPISLSKTSTSSTIDIRFLTTNYAESSSLLVFI